MHLPAQCTENNPERLIKTKTFLLFPSPPPLFSLISLPVCRWSFSYCVMPSLCFIKGCDLIIFSFCMSWAPVWNWYNASSDIGIVFCADVTAFFFCWRWWGNMHHCAHGSVFFIFFIASLPRMWWLVTESLNLLLCTDRGILLPLTHSSFNFSDLICSDIHAFMQSFMIYYLCKLLVRSCRHWLRLLCCACLDFIDDPFLW